GRTRRTAAPGPTTVALARQAITCTSTITTAMVRSSLRCTTSGSYSPIAAVQVIAGARQGEAMGGIEDPAAAVKAALDVYALTVEVSRGDAAAVINAAVNLQSAMKRFADSTFEASGWGNPFVVLPGDDDEGPAARSTGKPIDVVDLAVTYR